MVAEINGREDENSTKFEEKTWKTWNWTRHPPNSDIINIVLREFKKTQGKSELLSVWNLTSHLSTFKKVKHLGSRRSTWLKKEEEKFASNPNEWCKLDTFKKNLFSCGISWPSADHFLLQWAAQLTISGEVRCSRKWWGWWRTGRLVTHPRAAAGWCCLCWSPPQPSSSSSLLVSWGLVVVQDGQAGPTQLRRGWVNSPPIGRAWSLCSDWPKPISTPTGKRELSGFRLVFSQHLCHWQIKMKVKVLKQIIDIIQTSTCVFSLCDLVTGGVSITAICLFDSEQCSVRVEVMNGGFKWLGWTRSRPRDNSRRKQQGSPLAEPNLLDTQVILDTRVRFNSD